ncbi:hypothetical protein [Flavobacterium sp.]|uniref:hypothetical protein n=1 Tax=Flavobacterium sp. TaxID=239 RepID=UPI0031DE2046
MKTKPVKPTENLKVKDFTYSTKVAVSQGEKDIQLLNIGDTVLAFTIKQQENKIIPEVLDAKISFSSGATESDFGPTMVYINFIFGDSVRDLICSFDQVFLLSNGKYAKAGQLRPGFQLVKKDGGPADIINVSLGYFYGGIHNISTNAPMKDNPNGHLLLINGVIAGDFSVQLFFDNLPDDWKE